MYELDKYLLGMLKGREPNPHPCSRHLGQVV